jgi:type I restriction enzyme R subunit
MAFNEDTRVKIPAILTLTRLGYGYLSLKNRTDIDPQTNIFKDIFFNALHKLNPTTQEDKFKRLFSQIQIMLDNDDLGEEFYKLLTTPSGIKLIDFKNIDNNILNVATELPCINEQEEFRPDITLFINGLPLAFIEVKKPNNREGILAERDRINVRFRNRKFRRFINISQILLFTNNMPYEDNEPEPLQGSFYCSASKDKAFFNHFREEYPSKQYLSRSLKPLNEETEKFLLKDTNYPSLKGTKEFETNKDLETSANSAIISLFSPNRIFELLCYALCYKKYTDKEGRQRLEKHIMRYQQFFASKAIQEMLDTKKQSGIIWHTQGSGKTALAYFNVKWLTDYFSKKGILPKFYFIVDRIDLRTQATKEFNARGLKVINIEDKDDFIRDLRRNSVITGTDGTQEITVLNIHKFSEDSRATTQKDYDIKTRRIYFIDEAHRSYSPKGSFLANLFKSDVNAIRISLTGTPLLAKGETRIASTEIFGDYIHKYYYDQSVKDGYTLRLIREEIEKKYKLQLNELLKDINIEEGDARIKQIYAHKNFCTPLLEYILQDLMQSRIRFDNNSAGAMVVCHSSEQARELFKQFNGKQNEHNLTSALILHDEGAKEERGKKIDDFENGKIDILFVFNMLLTGFDAPRLKKLYLGRVIKEHNLLQALTRVNRPYQSFRFGYVVDFANIKGEFDKTNKKYWQELKSDWGKDLDGYNSLFKSAEEIDADINQIKSKLWQFDTLNAEIFQKQISQIKERKELLKIRKVLQLAAELYNIIRLTNNEDLLSKLNFYKFKQLLNETERRIALLAQSEALASGQDIAGMLNLALEDSIFIFRKTGEEQLNISANKFQDKLHKTRRQMQSNCDKRDPFYISLREELQRLLSSKNWDEASSQDIEQSLQILDDIYSRITELNRQNSLISAKYGGDSKYMRLHKGFMRWTPSLNMSVEQLWKILYAIKTDTDERLLNSDIIQTEAFFGQYIQTEVANKFANIDVQTMINIKDLIVKEYQTERMGAGYNGL